GAGDPHALDELVLREDQVVVDEIADDAANEEALLDHRDVGGRVLTTLEVLEDRPAGEATRRRAEGGALVGLRPVEIAVEQHGGALAGQEEETLPRLRPEPR